MIISKETRGVIMTPDKKCILRGHDTYTMKLHLLDEKSRLKLKMYKNTKGITDFIDKRFITVTDAVKKMYNLTNNKYNSEIMGELIGVKLKATYELEE